MKNRPTGEAGGESGAERERPRGAREHPGRGPRPPARPERRRRPRGRFDFLADAFYRTLRFIERHVRGFFGAVAAFLSVGFVVSGVAVATFTGFGQIVAQGITRSIDVAVLRAVAAYRTPLLDDAMFEITTLGNTFVVLVIVAVASVFLWLTRHHYSVYLLVIAVLGGGILSDLLKVLYDRPRPTVVPWVTETVSPSFPSGHAMTAMVAYGSVAYLVGRLEATPRLRRTTWALAVLFILAIGASRVYLGVHYPSDVLAGYLAGLAWLAFVASTLTVIRYFATRRPEVERAERDLHAEEERAAGRRA